MALPLTLVTLDDFVRTYRSDYHATMALERATRLGVIPLNLTADKFIPLNRLAAEIFWTGNLSVPETGSPMIGISSKDEGHLEQLQRYFAAHLDLSMEIYGKKGTVAFNLRGLNHSALYGRILMALGVPPAGEEPQLPRYIHRLLDSSPRTGQSRALCDFAHILFEERLHLNKKNNVYRLSFRACTTEEKARRHAQEVLKLLHKVLPKLSLDEDKVRIYRISAECVEKYNAHKEFYPYITMGVQGITCLVRHYRDFISLERPQPTWLTASL